MKIDVPIRPEMDPEFIPAVLWNRAYRKRTEHSGVPVSIALMHPDGAGSLYSTRILPPTAENESLTLRYLERLLKCLLWQRGGSRIMISGGDSFVKKLSAIYSSSGARQFDCEFFGEKVYRQPLEISSCAVTDLPMTNETPVSLGRHLDGCRIGFDLGGSDRKCAALIDGKIVFSEEVEWNPYFENNPAYHIEGINDTLKRAAAHLPRVDAIGGSAAGIYVDNEVRAASLFRGISPANFESKVRRLFFDLMARWGGIPFEVVNDGEVTALAGAMSMDEHSVLGISMGTSLAAGYVTPQGQITSWLNELAFAPVDYRDEAPADEWSGDRGCGVQYFSQQAVARLAPRAGLEFPDKMSFAKRLVEVQRLMADGDERAAKIYFTIGTCLGYAIAHWADFYDVRNVLLLGRVTSGAGGKILIEQSEAVLTEVFPNLGKNIRIVTPDEQMKRHGQAIAAASLPNLGKQR